MSRPGGWTEINSLPLLPQIRIHVPNRVPWLVGLTLIALPAAAQIALGAEIELVLMAAFTCLIGLAAFNLGGFYHAGSLAALAYVIKYMALALVVKTILLQPLQTHLVAPEQTFLMVMGGMLALFVALLAVYLIPVGRPLFKPTTDLSFLRYLSICCAVIGLLAWLIHKNVAVDIRFSFFASAFTTGAFGMFKPLFYMGIVAATAHSLVRSEGRRSISIWVAVLIGVGMLMALIDAQKTIVFLTILSYLLTAVCFRKYVTLRQVSVLLIGGVLGMVVAVPLIHQLRVKIWPLPFDQRVEYVMNNWQEMLSPSEIQRMRQRLDRVAERTYAHYLGDNYLVLDRFILLQYVDQIIGGINWAGTVPRSHVLYGLKQAMPGFLFPYKPRIPSGDLIMWHIGERTFGDVVHQTAPHIGGVYAVHRGWGLLVLPAIYLVFLLILKKVGWTLEGNIFMIYLFVRYGHNLAEQPLAGLTTLIVRDIPVDLVVLVILVGARQYLLRRAPSRRPDAVPEPETSRDREGAVGLSPAQSRGSV